MSRMKWLAATALFILGAFAGWYFIAPSYTLEQMKAAAKANDSDKFSSYIDFQALREDMKAQLMARMSAESQKDKSGFANFGMVIGSALIGPLVDGVVSPAGVRAAFIANERDEVEGPRNEAMQSLKLGDQPVIERRSFSEFAVSSKDHPRGAMIFKRHGLGWQLSGIELSPDPRMN